MLAKAKNAVEKAKRKVKRCHKTLRLVWLTKARQLRTSSGQITRVLVFVHFHGFPKQPLSTSKSACKGALEAGSQQDLRRHKSNH